MKTDLIILGAQKAATTTLFDMLNQSDHIAGAINKEPHFFSQTPDWKANLNAYHAIYEGAGDGLRCEASTTYTFAPHRNNAICDDLQAYNPDLKFIYIVRKPTDRILSHYRHNTMRGYNRGSIESFVRDYPLALDISRYHYQIMPYIETFGRENVLLLTFDDVIKQPESTLKSISTFLNLPEHALSAHARHSNVTGELGHKWEWEYGLPGRVAARITKPWRVHKAKTARLSPTLQKTINAELEPEVSGIENLMNRDLSDWRDIRG